MIDSPTAGANGSRSYNAAVDLLERNLEPSRASRPYLRTPIRVWSYQEVIAAADAAGAGLRDLGLQPGERVLLATGDRPEFVVTFWGAIKAGLVPVPIAPMFSASDLHFILTDSEARVLVGDASSISAGIRAVEETTVPCLMTGEEPPVGARAWSEVCGRPGTLRAEPTSEEQIVLWLYTSGTTG